MSHSIIVWLFIGLVAGGLAGRVVAGSGMGCLANIATGLAGALIGGALLDRLDPSQAALGGGVIRDTLVAFIGAALLLGLLRLLSGRSGGPLRPGSRGRR